MFELILQTEYWSG